MKRINNMNIKELKSLKKIISKYSSIDELMSDIEKNIKEQEENKDKTLNERVTLEKMIEFKFFEPYIVRVLEVNCIHNLEELRECDLNGLIGITQDIKEKLEWGRDFYNFNGIDPMVKKKRKNTK